MNVKLFQVFITAFVFTMLFSSLSYASDWQDLPGFGNLALNVDGGQYAMFPSIAVYNGTPYVAWQETNGTNTQIYVKKFNGLSWGHVSGVTESLNIDTNRNATKPKIAMTDDKPYVTWVEANGDTGLVFVKHYNGTSWEQLGNTLNVNWYECADNPDIAVYNGTPYVIWEEDTHPTSTPVRQIYVKKYSGGNWVHANGVAQSINHDPNYPAQFPAITIDDSMPYACFAEYNDQGYFPVYVKRLNSTIWEQMGTTIAAMSDTVLGSPKIKIINNVPYVVWRDSGNGHVIIYVKHFNGFDWQQDGTELNVDINLKGCFPHIIFLYSRPYVVWNENNNSSIYNNYVKHFNGIDWEQDGNAITTRGYAPDIEATNDRLFVAYEEAVGSVMQIFVKQNIPPTPTDTPTVTMTPTVTPTATITVTFTVTPTITATPTTTETSTITQTVTPTGTNVLAGIDLNGKPVLAFPNPAKNEMNFLIHLDQEAEVKVVIYNFAGDMVGELKENKPTGRGQVLVWDCSQIAPGVYLARVIVNGKETGKLKIAVLGKK